MTGLHDLIMKCQSDYSDATFTGDNQRRLVKLLREISLATLDDSSIHDELNKLFSLLWNDSVLLEDCILVSGFIFAKMHANQDFSSLCALSDSRNLRNLDWVELALLSGVLLRDLSTTSSSNLRNLARICEVKIFALLSTARSVLISRYIENLIQIFVIENTRTGSYDFASCGSVIVLIVSQTLRLKVDIVDYKSRDLIKFHINALLSKQMIAEYLQFTSEIVDSIPDSSKVALQIFELICSNRQVPLGSNLVTKIFHSTLSCLK